MAAPVVTGVVALMRERHPDWTPAQIRAALIGSAVPAFADSNGDDRGLAAAHRRRVRRRARRGRARRPLRPARARLRPAATRCAAGDRAGQRERRGRRCGRVAGAASIGTEGRRPGRSRRAPAEIAVPPAGAVLLPGHPDDRRHDAGGRRGGLRRAHAGHAHPAHPVLGARRAAALRHRHLPPAAPRDRARIDASASPTASSATAIPPTPGRSACPCAGAAARCSTASASSGARSTSA